MHALGLRAVGLVLALVLGLLALAALALASPISATAHASAISKGDPKDCDDFKTQKKAQKWFKKHHPRRDPAGLDADNDGIACEDNPCPCSYKLKSSGNRGLGTRRL